MPIEWGGLNLQSSMSTRVLDNTSAPTTVLDSSLPFNVEVSWQVPAGIAALLNSSHQFRLRAYAESIGPGPEQQIGGTVNVPAVRDQLNYGPVLINVPASTLLGEGQGVPPVSGTYKVVTVLQLLNGGATEDSGFAEAAIIQMRTP
ncbi:MAG: hypothetical protein N2688_02585 [Burkholderiaceae bacterium]|nr:hypothetical protein [Burkholderiaceae bacterium]